MSEDFKNISWPGWETVRLIGRGSFGAVYEIERKVFDETEKAALKVISIPQNSGDIDDMYSDGYDEESITSTFKSHLQSIVAEYSLMRKMNGSANIVNCDDVRYIEHDDGIGWDIFIKMELLTPLTKAVADNVDEKTVIKLAKDMCGALELCKKHGIVHRDIKPQNIFVSKHGDYKLGDFGVAKTIERTMGGTKIGTYKYMAPEVYNNQPYGNAADIYSLGLVLYWLLNERRMPFIPLPPEKLKAGVEESSRHRRLSGEKLPEPAHGNAALKQIVLKACAYDPKERYASAGAMLEDLNNLTGQEASLIPDDVPAAELAETQNMNLETNPISEPIDVVDDSLGDEQYSSTIENEEISDEEKTQTVKKKILFFRMGSIVLAVLAVILVFLLLRPSAGFKPQEIPTTDTENINATEGERAEGSTNVTDPPNVSTGRKREMRIKSYDFYEDQDFWANLVCWTENKDGAAYVYVEPHVDMAHIVAEYGSYYGQVYVGAPDGDYQLAYTYYGGEEANWQQELYTITIDPATPEGDYIWRADIYDSATGKCISTAVVTFYIGP